MAERIRTCCVFAAGRMPGGLSIPDKPHIGYYGYENVTVCATCENQKEADERLPVMVKLPIRHREVIHEPMLEGVDIRRYLATGKIEGVICGGESGPDARICDYGWILDSAKQCREYHVPFRFKQTGARFRKDGRLYCIPRSLQAVQARKAGINL